MSGTLLPLSLADKLIKKRPNKPLMERKRRERINNSLEQLKALVLNAMQKESSRPAKIEKADILEMSVRYLRTVQAAVSRDVSRERDVSADVSRERYLRGYSECLQEVTQYLDHAQGLTRDARARLQDHLTRFLRQKTKCALPAAVPGGGAKTEGVCDVTRSKDPAPAADQSAGQVAPALEKVAKVTEVSKVTQVNEQRPLAPALPLVAGLLPNGQIAFFITKSAAAVTSANKTVTSLSDAADVKSSSIQTTVKTEVCDVGSSDVSDVLMDQDDVWRPW